MFIVPQQRLVRIPDRPPLRIMVGHSWGQDEDYQRFIALISQYLVQGQDWINLSIPRDARIQTKGGIINDKRAILTRMRQAQCFVGLAHVDISHREFCQSEWDFALALNIPSIGVRPHDAQKVSRYAMDHATKPDVPWRALEVCLAICEVSKRTDLEARVRVRQRRLAVGPFMRPKAGPGLATRMLLDPKG